MQQADDECALMYSRDKASGDDLYNNGPACTSKVGLETSGPQWIKANGKRSALNDPYLVPPENRAWHRKGSGHVSVRGYFDDWGRWLGIFSYMAPSVKARVAYVADQDQDVRKTASIQKLKDLFRSDRTARLF